MTSPCPDPETLAAYRHARLSPPEQEALEAHASACRTCRGALLFVGMGAETPPARVWRVAAAALLAVSALGWLALRRDAPSTPVAPAPAQDTPLAKGMDLLADPGSRVTAMEGGRLRLEEGRLWLDTRTPVVLELPGAVLNLTQGELAARVLASMRTASWLLGEAQAATTPSVEIWVLAGEADAKFSGRALHLKAGAKLVLDGDAWREAVTTPEEAGSLALARARAAAALPGEDLFPPGLQPAGSRTERSLEVQGPYRWVTVIRDRDPATELGLSLGAAGGWHQWLVGLASSRPAPGEPEVVEVIWDGYWLTGRLNGRLLLSGRGEELKGALQPAPRPAWGLSVWGGRLTVAQSRIRRE